MLNRRGYKINGVKKAVSDLRNLDARGQYVNMIVYDYKTGWLRSIIIKRGEEPQLGESDLSLGKFYDKVTMDNIVCFVDLVIWSKCRKENKCFCKYSGKFWDKNLFSDDLIELLKRRKEDFVL